MAVSDSHCETTLVRIITSLSINRAVYLSGVVSSATFRNVWRACKTLLFQHPSHLIKLAHLILECVLEVGSWPLHQILTRSLEVPLDLYFGLTLLQGVVATCVAEGCEKNLRHPLALINQGVVVYDFFRADSLDGRVLSDQAPGQGVNRGSPSEVRAGCHAQLDLPERLHAHSMGLH